MKRTPFFLLGACLLILGFRLHAATFYVDSNGTNPTPPYADWTTASTDIQSAIDASSDGDLILVTNGVYATGGRVVYNSLTNRVVINKAVTVQSVNGPAATMIVGGQPIGTNAVRCVYMTNNAVLNGFTITNGGTLNTIAVAFGESEGGGVYCESTNSQLIDCLIVSNVATYMGGGGVCSGTLTDCVLSSNSVGFAAFGGGAYRSTLNHCTLIGNTAGVSGGAASSSALNYCTISGNSGVGSGGGVISCTLNNCVLISNVCAHYGGAAYNNCNLTNCLLTGNYSTNSDPDQGAGAAQDCNLNSCTVVGNSAGGPFGGLVGGTAENCIVYFNSNVLKNVVGNSYQTSMTNCCTTPLPSGTGNFTNAPIFVDSSADFHLLSNSPCINAGNNTYISGTNDLDGNPRIVGGTVDIGCYEYQTPASIISYVWLEQYGLPTDGTADYADSDGTGMNNWQKWVAGLNPTNPASVLVMQTPVPATNGVTVTWQSVNTRKYYLQSSTNLALQPSFSSIQSNIVGRTGTTSFTDTTATNMVPYFYRIGVQ